MKKLLYALVIALVSINVVCAVEFDEQKLKELMQNTTIPADEEIMNKIKKFNLSEEDSMKLYYETKRQLVNAYETGDTAPLRELINSPEVKKIEEQLSKDPVQHNKFLNEYSQLYHQQMK